MSRGERSKPTRILYKAGSGRTKNPHSQLQNNVLQREEISTVEKAKNTLSFGCHTND
jgi:hypothetical protein